MAVPEESNKAYDIRAKWKTPHLEKVLKIWHKLNSLKQGGESITVDGKSLDIAAVVALARNAVSIKADEKTVAGLEDSTDVLYHYLSKGYYLYGVNTGFGGSATTRTTDLLGLQRALMQLVQSAILTAEDKSDSPATHEYLESHSMPSSWVRASMLIRLNASIRGHSATQEYTLRTIIKLLENDVVPIIPLRGSLSASGDLMPLAYIAGAIQGNPDIYVRVNGSKGPPRVMTAEKALKELSIEPVVLGPKEGLSLINGTAAAAAVATLGMYEAHLLTVVAQGLTALGSEALAGNTEWAHPFIAAVRPHRGQIEAAQNIRTFLSGSKLTIGLERTKDRFKSGMAQERYAWRSTPQWLAPHLEDLVYAESQLAVELNSTADNPVINVEDDDVHCGANFQAASVTAATEKIRLSLQSIGKMLFSQVSEMINHDLSNGLPPNLAPDDPSLSFCLKGVDINTAAYTSELGFLANPVSNHVQAAEMHNQSINSLALLSARQTFAAIECLSMIVANTLYTACQGVDIRTLHKTFLVKVKPPVMELVKDQLWNQNNVLLEKFWALFEEYWYSYADLDAHERVDKVSEALATAVVDTPEAGIITSVEKLGRTKTALSAMVLEIYIDHRETFFRNPTTAIYLGEGTKVLYSYVRENLQIPMHRGLIEHPVAGAEDGNVIDGRPKKTIGSWVSTIYEAVRNGDFYDHVLHFLNDKSTDPRTDSNGNGYSADASSAASGKNGSKKRNIMG